MRRRSFLKATIATSLLGHAGCRLSDDERVVEDGFRFFPQSIASGDPGPESVIVWTRVDDPDGDPVRDVELEIWIEDGEPSDVVRVRAVAEADFDHCVKLRVTGLEPATTYGYRFVYLAADGRAYGSKIGRTRTAPPVDADVPVRFAFCSCHDYSGRWYNAYVHLLAQHEADPLDFFVHLGDYVYETADDERFQDTAAGRAVAFTDVANAIEVVRGEDESYFAASSLDNYRELYRIYRSDPMLQAVHENIPMIAVWDDHEFSDDCWGATATYYNGQRNEHDPDRRRRANRAWFEYMPVDYPEPEFVHSLEADPPNDIRIWRDLRFGKHVHLVMTDLRSHRTDHLVAEDAYPGLVVMDEAALQASGGVPDWASAYVEIDGYANGTYATLLREAAAAQAYPTEVITGPVSVDWINRIVDATGSALPILDEAAQADLPRGLAYHHMTKLSLWTRIGSRYLVTAEAWRRFAAMRWQQSNGASETVMGEAQETWFLQTMQSSSATWKVWGNEYCLTQLDIDLRAFPIPDTFKQLFSLSAEDWNGLPNRRAHLINELAAVPNVVAITGDIHAFFASTPFAGDPSSNSIVEFVGGSITSTAYQSLLERQVADDPLLSSTSGASQLAAGIQELLLIKGTNPQMGFAKIKEHGFAIARADATAFTVDMFIAPETMVEANQYDDPDAIAAVFGVERFKVDAGSRSLFRDFDGEWRRWDPSESKWV